MTPDTPERDEAMAQPDDDCDLLADIEHKQLTVAAGSYAPVERGISDLPKQPRPAPPDATLDGLLEKFEQELDDAFFHDSTAGRQHVEKARAAIHAYVAQRDSLLEMQKAIIGNFVKREREKDAEIARLREALRELRDGIGGEAAMVRWAAGVIDAALASPPPAEEVDSKTAEDRRVNAELLMGSIHAPPPASEPLAHVRPPFDRATWPGKPATETPEGV